MTVTVYRLFERSMVNLNLSCMFRIAQDGPEHATRRRRSVCNHDKGMFRAATLLLIVLPLHAIVVGAGGFVASSKAGRTAASTIAAAGDQSRTNPSSFVACPAERESRRRHRHGNGNQPSAATCVLGDPSRLVQLTSRCGQILPATTAAGGAGAGIPAAKVSARLYSRSTPIDGILAPVKEKVKMRGERDDVLDTLVLYFAFGANMCPSIFVDTRGIRPLESFPAEAKAFADGTRQKRDGTRDLGNNGNRASLKGEEDGEQGICLCFCHRAGYATLTSKPGPPQSWETSPGAHGVLYAVSSADLEKIAAYEIGYRKRLVEVESPAGKRDVAVCFVSNPSQMLPTSVPPTSRYLALLQEGAAHHGVDERYRSWLARLPSVPPENESTSPERTNTPSKVATDAVVTVIVVAGLVLLLRQCSHL